MSVIRPRHLLIILMAAALALISVVAALRQPSDERIHLYADGLGFVTIGLGMGWAGLASCYLVFGRQPLWLRVPACTLVAVAGGAVSAPGAASGRLASPDYRGWCGVLLFAAFVSAVPLMYMWARGLRLTHAEHPPIEYWKPRGQFSLGKLFALITCSAVLLAVGVRLRFPVNEIDIVLTLCGMTAIVTYAAGVTLLSRIPLYWACLAIPSAVIAAGAALARVISIDLAHYVLTPLGVTAIVLPWMALLRGAGYYLYWPDYSALETVGPNKRLVDEEGNPVELAQPLRLHQPPEDADEAQSNHSSEQSNLG